MHDAMPDRLHLSHGVHRRLELRIVHLAASSFEVLFDENLVVRRNEAHLQ